MFLPVTTRISFGKGLGLSHSHLRFITSLTIQSLNRLIGKSLFMRRVAFHIERCQTAKCLSLMATGRKSLVHRWTPRVIFGNYDTRPASVVRLRKPKDQRVRFTASMARLGSPPGFGRFFEISRCRFETSIPGIGAHFARRGPDRDNCFAAALLAGSAGRSR
jgi:hypothetical protein